MLPEQSKYKNNKLDFVLSTFETASMRDALYPI